MLMGKIAAGKGTQADLILSHFGGVLYSNGNKVREVAQQSTVFGHHMKEAYESGKLVPEWVVTYWMTHAILSQHPDEQVVFEAVAKKPHEAELFHEIHEFVGRPYIVFHIEISDDQVRERSEKRNRDVVDSRKSVETRLNEYAEHTSKSIEIFKNKGTLVTIDGSGTPEEVREQIFKHLIT